MIEDDADAREALGALLQLDGHQVAAAGDGAHGMALASATPPDVALIDLGLPGLDGYEVARRMRATVGRGPVLIALTGYGQPEDRQRTAEAGFDDHLVKPVDPTDLSRLLSKLAAGRKLS
ncbi:MAG: response regulator [Candidatus Rokuibacteriota bacterium]